jgi:hypothetical protein
VSVVKAAAVAGLAGRGFAGPAHGWVAFGVVAALVLTAGLLGELLGRTRSRR